MKPVSRLYVFEGPDDVGKTTLALALVEHLKLSSGGCQYHSFPGRDEGTLGRFVYDFHHQADTQKVLVDATSLQLLHVAAHIDTIERHIRRALEAHITVVLDRFWWSTWIYGVTSGANQNSLKTMINVEKMHWQGILPTAIFVIERHEPFGASSTPEWKQVAHAYNEASSRKDWGYPVHRIKNESTFQDVMEQIIRHL